MAPFTATWRREKRNDADPSPRIPIGSFGANSSSLAARIISEAMRTDNTDNVLGHFGTHCRCHVTGVVRADRAQQVAQKQEANDGWVSRKNCSEGDAVTLPRFPLVCIYEDVQRQLGFFPGCYDQHHSTH